MPELPNCTGKEAVKALKYLTTKRFAQSGSHVRLKHLGRTSLAVPVHHGRDLAKGTLRKIASNSGFSVGEFKAEI